MVAEGGGAAGDALVLLEGSGAGPALAVRNVVASSVTDVGGDLLAGSRSPVVQLGEVIARTHHEHWDGTGYPAGLAGEAIPLAGRITAVCDVFDALVSERPYKSPWAVEDALDEIRALSGSQFDPELLALFLGVVAEAHPRKWSNGHTSRSVPGRHGGRTGYPVPLWERPPFPGALPLADL